MERLETIRAYGAIIVSILALITFTAALVTSFIIKDEGLLNLTVGAAIANSTIAVGYWLGSSSSTAHKDQLLANGKGEEKPKT